MAACSVGTLSAAALASMPAAAPVSDPEAETPVPQATVVMAPSGFRAAIMISAIWAAMANSPLPAFSSATSAAPPSAMSRGWVAKRNPAITARADSCTSPSAGKRRRESVTYRATHARGSAERIDARGTPSTSPKRRAKPKAT